MTYTCRIIHSCAHNPAFCSSYQPLLRLSELSPMAAETDLWVGGIFTECLVYATSAYARDKRQFADAGAVCAHLSRAAACRAPKRFRFKSLLISIQAPPPRTPVSEIGLFKISVHTRRDDGVHAELPTPGTYRCARVWGTRVSNTFSTFITTGSFPAYTIVFRVTPPEISMFLLYIIYCQPRYLLSLKKHIDTRGEKFARELLKLV